MAVGLAAGAIFVSLAPVRRVDTITTHRTPATGATATDSAMQVEKEIRSEEALPDALVGFIFAAAAACLFGGLFYGRVEEISFAGTKVNLARAVAGATLQKARDDGVVQGESVPTAAVKQMLESSAALTVDVQHRLLTRSGHPIAVGRLRAGSAPATAPISRRLLDDLATEIVREHSETDDEA